MAVTLKFPPLHQPLPPTSTTRWVVSRKARVVDAIRKGEISVAEACDRYDLSEEEVRGWMKLNERGGKKALRVTRIHDYRTKQGKTK